MVDIDALEALEKAATPGPWAPEVVDTMAGYCGRGPPCKNNAARDATLIAAARNALPTLLAELKAAREVIEKTRSLGNGFFPDVKWLRPVRKALAAYDALVGKKS